MGDSVATGAVRLQNMRNGGSPPNPSYGIKHIIVTIHPGDNWAGLTMSAWQTFVTNVVNGMKGKVDAWSIGNEPSADGAGQVGGAYWPKFRVAADICHSLDPGTPVVLAAPWANAGIQLFLNNANTDFNNQPPGQNDIRNYADAWDVHLYGATADANLAQLQARRAQVDGFTKSWSAMPVYITETGWSCYSPPGAYQNAVPPGDTAGTNAGTQSGNMRRNFEAFRDNRTALKVRACIWYIWQDIDSLKNVSAGYDGAKKARFTESVNSPPAGVQPSPIAKSPNGYRPSYTVLLSFFKVYDAAAVAPPVVTTTTPAINITQNSATLKGTVNPQGKATTFYFDYGPTASYGTTTVGASAGSGSTAVPVQANITGLTPGTTYHFRCRAVNADGADVGPIDRTLTTDAPPLAPTVTPGAVTGVTTTGATIWGGVNPNGLAVTNYHFEYGTTSFTTSTTAGTLPAGTAGKLVAASLTGLLSGQTYIYRLIATNSSGTTTGATRSFTLTPPPSSTAPELQRTSVLSTLLSVEVTTSDSRSFRWDAENSDARNRPLQISFATQQGDGFAEANCTLPRPIDLDWPDLHLLDNLRLIGADGSIAYEGRVASMPRKIDSDGETIEIQAQGLMASARDRTFTDIIVDRASEGWQPPSLALRKAFMDADIVLDADYTASTDAGNIHFKGVTNKRINANSQACLEYVAPPGVKLSRFSYIGSERNISNETAPILHAGDSDTETMGNWDEAIDLDLDFGAGLKVATPAIPRSIFGLRLRCQDVHGDGTNPALPANRRFDKVAVYSNHGIPLRNNGNDPDGVWASDVITNLINRFCPLLNANGVLQTTTVISHLVFDSPTTPFDAFSLVNGYHLWSLGAWENGTVIFEPADLDTIDWQVRSDDMGVTLNLEGDAVDQFANGCVVSYSDVNSRDQNLYPDQYEELRDDDVNNPANMWGIDLWMSLELSNPVDVNGAVTLGKVALSEFNRGKAPGNVNLNLGYIEDGRGNLQPGWKVRAGQTISISDLPNEEPRLITGTSWSEDGTLQINISQPSTRVDAVLARLELSSQVAGL